MLASTVDVDFGEFEWLVFLSSLAASGVPVKSTESACDCTVVEVSVEAVVVVSAPGPAETNL